MKKEALSWWRMHLEDDPTKRPHSHVKAQIDGVERFLGLEPRSRVLDLGCGSGRRTLELARRGHRVLGIDPDERALTEARAAAKSERLNVHFIKSDPRKISYRGEFDAVVSLDGAFGQLPGDRDDARALDCVRKSLKPGAKLLIDVLNKEWLMRHFEPNFWEHGDDGRGAVVLDQISFDFEKGRLDNKRTIVSGDGKRTPSFLSVRIYALTELIAQAERAGLEYRQAWGGFDGAAYGMESARLIVLAERPRTERAPRRSVADDGLPTAIRIKGRR
ncbi:MAG: class I SAM-dependent methyltransferase [Elusimicrobia bacterium]|nr:class I SAM-dependent methyltransferase [Elusimicrobiota bacterium]MDE2511273.1 class I SAM-dependent methyltransferase [Elusimicrobiota bacterium]